MNNHKTLKNTVYISIGTNKGNRFSYIKKSIVEIRKNIGKPELISDIFESKSWGYNDAEYLNAALKIKTNLLPEEFLRETKNIEKKLGRKTKTQIINDKAIYSSRVIDIDILFYNDIIYKSENLTIPHPLLQFRRFVLKPLMQIAPDYIHPELNETIKTLNAKCKDEGEVVFYDKF